MAAMVSSIEIQRNDPMNQHINHENNSLPSRSSLHESHQNEKNSHQLSKKDGKISFQDTTLSDIIQGKILDKESALKAMERLKELLANSPDIAPACEENDASNYINDDTMTETAGRSSHDSSSTIQEPPPTLPPPISSSLLSSDPFVVSNSISSSISSLPHSQCQTQSQSQLQSQDASSTPPLSSSSSISPVTPTISKEISNNLTAQSTPSLESVQSPPHQQIERTSPSHSYPPTPLASPRFSLFDLDEREIIPDHIQTPPLLSPLYMPDPMLLFCPHLIDVVAGSLPAGAWDWESVEVAIPPSAISQTEKNQIPKEQKRESVEIQETFDAEKVLQKDARGYVMHNLYETEENYAKDLMTILIFFRERLRGIVSEPASRIIFDGINDLVEFHKIFFAEMQDLVRNWDTNTTAVGGFFLKHKTELKSVYANFIDCFALSQKIMRREEKENPAYAQFNKDCLSMKETNRSQLKDFMILPVQRTTRYHLLLKDLLKHTKPEHKDHAALSTALLEMNSLAAEVNDKKRKEEESTGLFEAYEQTKNCPPTLINAKRRLVMQVDVICMKTGKSLHLFICSDLLMITQNTRGGWKFGAFGVGVEGATTKTHAFKYIRWLDLRELKVEETELDSQKNVIKITHTYNGDRWSQTTFGPDVSKDHPGHPTGTSYYYYRFEGLDAAKSRNSFVMALQSEIKANITGTRDR